MDWTVWIYIFIYGLLFVVGIYWLLIELKYKHKVIIREIAKGRKLITIDRARDYTDDKNVTWWRLRKEKDKIKRLMPVPPPETIEIMKRGKKYTEVYRTEQGEYIFIEDNMQSAEIPDELRLILDNIPEEFKHIKDNVQRDELIHKKRNQLIKRWQEDNNIVRPLQPLTTNQRVSLVTNIAKAKERRTHDWKRDLPMYASLGAFVLFFISMLIFMPDIINTVRDLNGQYSSSIEHLEEKSHEHYMEQLRLQKEITENIQHIGERIDTMETDLGELEDRKVEE